MKPGTHSNFLRKDSRRAYKRLIVLQNKNKKNFKAYSVHKERNPKKQRTLALLSLRDVSFRLRSRELRTRFGFRSWEPRNQIGFRSREPIATSFEKTAEGLINVLLCFKIKTKRILRLVPFLKNGTGNRDTPSLDLIEHLSLIQTNILSLRMPVTCFYSDENLFNKVPNEFRQLLTPVNLSTNSFLIHDLSNRYCFQ